VVFCKTKKKRTNLTRLCKELDAFGKHETENFHSILKEKKEKLKMGFI